MMWVAFVSFIFVSASGNVEVYESKSRANFNTYKECVQDAAKTVAYIADNAERANIVGFTAICKPIQAS